MRKYALKFGLYSGLVISALMMLSMSMMKGDSVNFSTGELIGYASMLLALSLVFVGTKIYRDRENGGYISFKEAFKLGLSITLIASVIYAIWWMIYYSAGPGEALMEQYFDSGIEALKNSGANQEEIDEAVASGVQFKEMYENPFIRFGFTLMEILPVGVLVTVISSLILRKKA